MSALLIAAIVALPLVAALLLLLCGNQTPRPLVAWASLLATGGAALAATKIAWYSWGHGGQPWSVRFAWFELAGRPVDLSFSVRPTTACLVLIVAWLSWVVHLYAWGYMQEKLPKGSARFAGFFALLGFFTAAMQFFVVSSNFLQLYIGWEALGVASFLLIGFWQQKKKAQTAAVKAFLMTRIGDLCLLGALGLTWYFFKTWDVEALTQLVAQAGPGVKENLWILGVLVGIAALAKAGQVPLQTWLPDAMAGPTPVSALLHAATMVVAGIYLVDQFFYFFPADSPSSALLLYAGAATALYASVMACLQTELKRLLAYSTASHLGFMFIALSLQLHVLAFLLLLAHAAFKLLLFLIGGALIAPGRERGPFLCTQPMMALWALALLAMVDFAGIKTMILRLVFLQLHWLPFLFLLIAYGATYCYGLRLLLQLRVTRTKTKAAIGVPRGPMGLGILVAAVVCLAVQLSLNFNMRAWCNWLGGFDMQNAPFVPSWFSAVKILTLCLGLVAAIAIVRARSQRLPFDGVDPWDGICRAVLLRPLRSLADGLYALEAFVVEGLLKQMGWLTTRLGCRVVGWQQGQLQAYLCVAVGTIAICLLSVLCLRGW